MNRFYSLNPVCSQIILDWRVFKKMKFEFLRFYCIWGEKKIIDIIMSAHMLVISILFSLVFQWFPGAVGHHCRTSLFLSYV